MTNAAYFVNPGKQEIVGKKGRQYYCYAIKTRVVTDKDSLQEIVEEYAKPILEPGDILFASEKMVACTQKRAIPIDEIHPGFWARFLSKYVKKTEYGIGLAMPQTMQCAIDECGLPRILLASFVGAVGKVFRQSGWFYHVAGRKAAAVDGPCHWTIPPYDHYVVLAPTEPGKVATEMSGYASGHTVLIVDLNDLGGEILGSSDPSVDIPYMCEILKQNPLGQTNESTPMGILRPLQEASATQ